MVHLDYRDARPIHRQISEGLREQILAGVLREGDKLPSVRELATQLTINPNTIQRAYRELEAEGWIASVAGKGCFVCELPNRDSDRQPLLSSFDQAVAGLLALGMTRQELMERLAQGGQSNAAIK